MGFDTPEKYRLLSIRELWGFPANQVGGWENVWVTTEYGLSQSWVMTEATVCTIFGGGPSGLPMCIKFGSGLSK